MILRYLLLLEVSCSTLKCIQWPSIKLQFLSLKLTGLTIAAGRRIFHLPFSLYETLFRADSMYQSDRSLVKLFIGGPDTDQGPCRGREMRPLLTSSTACRNVAWLGQVSFSTLTCHCRKLVIQELSFCFVWSLVKFWFCFQHAAGW